ncbi:UDP-2,4-diacetamido-2,4,6-trideoxy-beta-L-altropyranose hydrolase [Shinella daejeonensis]|uniref:UDP-2,4-diacetamido-2,4, 6-trideoxy-beta-L-altropyranose hydrolase n=1 Tax=Shinella daejeonensis TaxID=659017 RepID=UPI0020C75769|nr:UDP-2,4-diacetamido-2,4,6-trideoxy-beta-L-altropyranose hydrolase [Shinella daejeonensis]MCP8893954.1 UDP-2,4-diacetamido-2,4,6-trideoxy-beta-L-altropyranose hydrolase [Shinella daejeonensis]
MAPRIVFRADASTEIGLGHIMRCLTLADVLRQRGAKIAFICRDLPGFTPELVTDRGYRLERLPAGAPGQGGPAEPAHGHWLGAPLADEIARSSAILAGGVDGLVMDHYALDRRWQQAMRPLARRLMVIDDLADRAHDCDLLLDQTLGRRQDDYRPLVPAGTRLLLGTAYALLRPGFAAARAASLSRRAGRNTPERILVSMGGVDRLNLSARALEALAPCAALMPLAVTVILGPAAPWRKSVAALAEGLPFPVELAVDPPDIPALLAHCDLAIGGGGGSAWERCAMGLPSIVVVMAENQINGAEQLRRKGASVTIGSPDDMAARIPALMAELGAEGRLAAMSAAAAGIVDGLGAPRVADALWNEMGE